MQASKESSLTAPSDRDRTNKWKPEQDIPPLTRQQTTEAAKELSDSTFIQKFPRVDRTYADPPIPLQSIGLISFVPAKGATPNEKGIYGFAKLRGNYGSLIESNQRAEQLIREVDSYHKIYHTYVGRPFPFTESSDYSAETEEIDIRKETTKAMSNSVKEKKKEERDQIRDIKQREEALLEESKQEDEDPYDHYITLRVKKAQLSWTYLEHQKKMAEVKEIILKTREEIAKMDEETPEFKDKYYEKYMKARQDAGLTEEPQESQDNFIKYMVEDADLGF